MAKQIGPNKITGTYSGVSFYKSEGEYYVRMAGGPTRAQIRRSPKFARVRENIAEFTRCSQAGALLRKTLGCVMKAGDKYAYQRLTQRLTEVKSLDSSSVRGERNVTVALRQDSAKQLLCGFNFNSESLLHNILIAPFTLSSQNEICICGLASGRGFLFPNGAGYAVMSAARMHINFEAGKSSIIRYSGIRLNKNGKSQDIALKPESDLSEGGNELYFLQVKFYTLEDSKEVLFNNGRSDALCLIAVDPSYDNAKGAVGGLPVLRGERLPFEISRSQKDNRTFSPFQWSARRAGDVEAVPEERGRYSLSP